MNRFWDFQARMDSPMHWMLLLLPALELFSLVGAIPYQTPLVTLEELRSLNASCNGQDTCRLYWANVARYWADDSMQIFSCQCGPYCIRYGTCCMDAPAILNGEVMQGYMEGLDCDYAMREYYYKNVHFVQSCPKDWDGDDSVRDLCVSSAEEKSDLMLLVPVSSRMTGITYRNHYCYVCNTVDELNDSFISWDIKVLMPHQEKALFDDLSTLTYNPDIFHWTFPGAPEHLHLHLVPEPPAKLLENFSIFCRNGILPNVISACAQNWTDEVTRSKCGFYTALVSMVNEEGIKQYRNVHCGMCNWASLATVKCPLAGDPSEPFVGSAKVFREIFLISEVPKDRCPEGKLYDKVTNNCRNFRCGKKMEMVKGRCVKKE